MSAAASRRHVDASLELFALWTKQTRERYEREESSPRARRLFADGGSIDQTRLVLPVFAKVFKSPSPSFTRIVPLIEND